MDERQTRTPEFIWLDGQLTREDLELALRELEVSGISDFAQTVIWTLSRLTASERLRRAISKAARILSWRPVSDILTDGLLPAERDVLLELDDLQVSKFTRSVVHQLLGLKERWIFTKCMDKIFQKSRRARTQITGI